MQNVYKLITHTFKIYVRSTVNYQVQIKETIKASRHKPLSGETRGDRWIPLTKACIAVNVSIWWRHRVWREHFSVMKSQWTIYHDTFFISAFLRSCTSKTWCHLSPVALPSSTKLVSSLEPSEGAGGCRKCVAAKINEALSAIYKIKNEKGRFLFLVTWLIFQSMTIFEGMRQFI